MSSDTAAQNLAQGAQERVLFAIMKASAVIYRRRAAELDHKLGDEPVVAPSLTVGRHRKLKGDPYATARR